MNVLYTYDETDRFGHAISFNLGLLAAHFILIIEEMLATYLIEFS